MMRQGVVRSQSRDLFKKTKSQGIPCLLLAVAGELARLSVFSKDLQGLWTG
jgi:hypothetical protein